MRDSKTFDTADKTFFLRESFTSSSFSSLPYYYHIEYNIQTIIIGKARYAAAEKSAAALPY